MASDLLSSTRDRHSESSQTNESTTLLPLSRTEPIPRKCACLDCHVMSTISLISYGKLLVSSVAFKAFPSKVLVLLNFSNPDRILSLATLFRHRHRIDSRRSDFCYAFVAMSNAQEAMSVYLHSGQIHICGLYPNIQFTKHAGFHHQKSHSSSAAAGAAGASGRIVQVIEIPRNVSTISRRPIFFCLL